MVESNVAIPSSAPKGKKQRSPTVDDDQGPPSGPRLSGVRSTRDRLKLEPSTSENGGIANNGDKQQEPANSFVYRSSNAEVNRRKPKKTKPSQHKVPRSVSEEVLAIERSLNTMPDSSVHESVIRKKTNRRRDLVQDSSVNDDGDKHLGATPAVRIGSRSYKEGVKKKRKPRLQMLTSGEEDNYAADGEISEGFPVDQEDLVVSSQRSQSSSSKYNPSSVLPPLPSEPLNVLFIEKKDGQGFSREQKAVHSDGIVQYSAYQRHLMQSPTVRTPLDVALNLHLSVRSLSMICHGLLAGMSLTQCVFVYSLNNTSSQTFLLHYFKLAWPLQSAFFFLLAICIVSACDRYLNLGSGWGPLCLHLLSKPARGIALVVYVLTFVLSASLARLDDRISLYKDLPHLWADVEVLSVWKVVNLLRTIGSVLGWFLVASSPSDDVTCEHLKEYIKESNSETTQAAKQSVV